jgi:hypothetical protein
MPRLGSERESHARRHFSTQQAILALKIPLAPSAARQVYPREQTFVLQLSEVSKVPNAEVRTIHIGPYLWLAISPVVRLCGV